MTKIRNEFRLYAEWTNFTQIHLEDISKHINQAVERLKLRNHLKTISNLDVLEECNEVSNEHQLQLTNGGYLLVNIVHGPLLDLKLKSGIRRISILFKPQKNKPMRSKACSNILYNVLWRIDRKLESRYFAKSA